MGAVCAKLNTVTPSNELQPETPRTHKSLSSAIGISGGCYAECVQTIECFFANRNAEYYIWVPAHVRPYLEYARHVRDVDLELAKSFCKRMHEEEFENVDVEKHVSTCLKACMHNRRFVDGDGSGGGSSCSSRDLLHYASSNSLKILSDSLTSIDSISMESLNTSMPRNRTNSTP